MKSRVLLAASIAFAFAGAVLAESGAPRTYVLSSNQAVRLSVPQGWTDTVTNSLVKPVVTVRFSAAKGAEFAVLMTFGPPEGTNTLRADVERAARKLTGASEQGRADIKNLKGKQTEGYYFSLTDKAPKQGEWKYLTQGVVRIEGWQAAFTILSNDPGLKIHERGLDMVRSAVLVSPSPQVN
jgi:hypothetical protein